MSLPRIVNMDQVNVDGLRGAEYPLVFSVVDWSPFRVPELVALERRLVSEGPCIFFLADLQFVLFCFVFLALILCSYSVASAGILLFSPSFSLTESRPLPQRFSSYICYENVML